LNHTNLCRERTAHAETRKREDALKLQFDQAVAQRDFWETTCDEKDAEIAKERTAHAEMRKRIDEIELNLRMTLDMGESIRVHEGGGPEDIHKSIVVTVESLRRELTATKLKLASAEARVKELENADKAIRDCVKWANGREYESGERIENAFGFLHRYLDATMPRKDS